MPAFTQECEAQCRRELDSRIVTLLMSGSHVEINADVTSTRLYQNMTAATRSMGFYEVKNAKLVNIYEGEGEAFPTSCSKSGFSHRSVSNAPFNGCNDTLSTSLCFIFFFLTRRSV